MRQYGNRYIEVDQFIDYCRDLNVDTSKEELEHYERKCLMLPTARTLQPPAQVKARDVWASTPGTNVIPPAAENAWLRLQDDLWFADHSPDLAQPSVDHPFDRQFGRNTCLERPVCGSRKPNEAYEVEVGARDKPWSRSREESYYGYWQVHQIVLLQQHPDLWSNLSLLNAIPEDSPVKRWRWRWADETFRTLRGWASTYEALSLWGTRRNRKRHILFARIPESRGYRQLPKSQAVNFERWSRANAKRIWQKHELTDESIIGFLRYLTDLRDDYRSDGRERLAKDVSQDIFLCAAFVFYVDRSEWSQVGDRLAAVGGYFLRESFLRTDPLVASRRDAERNLSYIFKECTKRFATVEDQAEPEDIAHFLFDKGLFEVLDAVKDYTYTEGEQEEAWYGFYFRRMRVLGLALEQFAKALAQEANKTLSPNARLPFEGGTLTPLVGRLFRLDPEFGSCVEDLWPRKAEPKDRRMRKESMVSLSSQADASRKLLAIAADQDLAGHPQVKNLLIACLARNVAIHTAPTEWDDIRERQDMGQMIDALCTAMIQLWRTAKDLRWVEPRKGQPSPFERS